ncbi:hypothetical protein TW86_19380 [Halomonas sp. S2151]|uniref:Uncharacterized protein n=2 Tax=Halomonas TaxID=2745 RepID=A0AAU7KDW0_9GAMM|nr:MULTISPECIES: hypothetical protein [Halomonas]KJZ06383.1 hypothetical protein TW86_19380 [Halomonas sp. S2151]PTL90885.1 hypothetical protein C6W89_10160 [Halomonas sp. SYSU XM8]PTL93525.1 hypothetical protein C6W88_14455 [Halomonas litopenaei]USZ48471.1 hypothetical protein NKF27_13245 [Halomonas sp. DN3]|tara:strand:+ start:3194 stop:3847 length:654 start_codon:yes stop_codon:yes gene_type:complete
MKVVKINEPQQREACLARLCAEAYGHQAGIAPLVTFAGVIGVLFKQEAARLLALVDDQSRPIALALLVSDEAGTSMNVAQLTSLDPDAESAVDGGNKTGAESDSQGEAQKPAGKGKLNPALRLVAELALRAPLRVDVVSDAQKAEFSAAGIQRWIKGPGELQIGLGPKHTATSLDNLPRTLTVDEASVVANFKQDKALFEDYKNRFVRGLESFPRTL